MASKTTTDHETIRDWAERRGGKPSRVKGTGGDGILRIDFDAPEEGLEEIDWDEWFRVFDQSGLALIYQEKTSGGATSRFNRIVER